MARALGDDGPNPDCRAGEHRLSPKSPKGAPGSWRQEPPVPDGTVEGGVTAVGGTVYAAGGSAPHDLRRVLAFNVRQRRWSEPTRLPVGLNHFQPVAYKGALYVTGGFLEGNHPTGRFFRYEPSTTSWSELPSMRVTRGATGAAVIQDRLYVVGGGPNDFPEQEVQGETTLEIYDFRTRRWTRGPDMRVRRHHLAAAAVDGKLYALGGRRRGDQSLNSVERYDPGQRRWETLPSIPLGVSAHGAVGAGGRLVVVGGADETGWEKGGGWVTPAAWALEPSSLRWSRLPDLRTERRGFGAAFSRGRVYAVTGAPCSGLGPKGPAATRSVESLGVGRVGGGP